MNNVVGKIVLLSLFLFSSKIASADTFVTAPISSDTTWTTTGGVYVIDSDFLVLPDTTLTIEAGVVVKAKNTNIRTDGPTILGEIIIKGTKENPVIFTSFFDDIGGDTNEDSETSSSTPGSWQGLHFKEGGVGEIENLILKDAGAAGYGWGKYSAIRILNGNVSIKNSEFKRNYATLFDWSVGHYNHGYAIQNVEGSLDITDSIFEDNIYGIYQNNGTSTIRKSVFKDNLAGIRMVDGNIDVTDSVFENNKEYAVFNESTNTLNAINNWWNDAAGPIVVNGEINDPREKVRGNVLFSPFLTSLPGTEQKINPVIIVPGIMGSAYKNGKLVIDPILHAYDDLIDTLTANGYEKEKTLFPFPYEWRDSNVLTALSLRTKINEAKEACTLANLNDTSCYKVDVVAHSMGGLVARQYIQSNHYQNDIDQLIFLGTPHQGSPKAYLQWEGGRFPDTFFDMFAESFFQAEALKNGYKNIFSYIQNRPITSVQELLPTFDYLKDKSTVAMRTYPTNYPRNNFLEDLNSQTGINKLLNSGVKITNIVGDSGEDKTIEKIRIVPSNKLGLWEHGEPDGFYVITGDKGLERGSGDNTVTLIGSTLHPSITNETITASHDRIPVLAQRIIFKTLTGKEPVVTFDNNYGLDSKALIIQLLSPVDFVVTAPDGKKVGKDFSTNTEYDQIPGAFYSGHQTDQEYIVILNPQDGEYKVQTQGTDSGGKYTVLTSFITETKVATSTIEGVTSPNQITDLEIKIDESKPDVIETERQVTLELLIQDIEGAYRMKWIKDRGTKEALIAQAKLIVKSEKKRNGKFEKVVDKILLRLLETELKLLVRKNKITKEAFDLLQKDLEFILKNN